VKAADELRRFSLFTRRSSTIEENSHFPAKSLLFAR
jgi:hypothetical protein